MTEVKYLQPVMDGSMNLERICISSMLRHGEAASANKAAAKSYVTEFKEYVEAEGFCPPTSV